MKNKRWRGAGVVAIALLFASGIAFGQAPTGNLFATAQDEQGAGLPGVSVTLTGVSAPLTQVTNINGQVRFLTLSPAKYELDFALQGFGKVSRKNITVSIGQNTEITVTMKLAGVQESVVVTGESPLLDTRKSGSQQTISNVELSSVPSARDPWVILSSAPGVQVDRVNVGGSESGQQAVYISKGSTAQSTWNVDGVNITDMAALGSSPTYYDFDAFAEMSTTIGGADASIQTPGLQLNMVTKRGTNDVHGSARIFYEDKTLASTNIPDEVHYEQTFLGRNPAAGNSIDNLQDYGAEIGGPVLKDHLWLWGSFNQTQINLVVPGGSTDKTTLKNYGLKLNAQVVPENSFTVSYLDNDKIKFGRNAGPTRPQETTFDQKGPGKIYKLEDSHVFSSDFFADVTYARVMGGFQLVSEGQAQSYIDVNGVFHNSSYNYYTLRPQTQFSATPSFFLKTGNVNHEFKAGFTYRKTPVTTTSSFPGGVRGLNGENWLGYAGAPDLAEFERIWDLVTDQKFYSGYVSDTMTINKLTVNVGVRYDYQWGQNSPVSVPLAFDTTIWPQLPMIPLSVPGTDPLIWKDFSPRISASYALPDNKTILRASYARFVNQMGSGNVTTNGINPGATYLYYPWNDKNGNHRVDPGEVDFSNLYSYYNWDPKNPNSTTASINKVNYNMKTPHTDEFLISGEHELIPAFVVGVQGTYRRMSDFVGTYRMSADGSRVLNASDFTCKQVGPYPVPGEDPQYVQQCTAKPGVAGVGVEETNRPGYYQTYWGIDLNATKRYADKWMARFNFTYQDWTQHGLSDGQVDPANQWGGSEAEGGQVLVQSTGSGSKGNVWINSKWQGTLTGMYTLPLDFNVSTSMYARQGYAAPYYVRLGSTGIPGISTLNYQLGPADLVRMPTIFEWDLGLSKVVKVGNLNITLQADCFNVLNRNTTIQRQLRVYSPSTSATNTDTRDNYIYEFQSPRIFRLGGRISF